MEELFTLANYGASERGYYIQKRQSAVADGQMHYHRHYQIGYVLSGKLKHIREKAWKFLIRIQDTANSYRIAAGLDLPATEEFDLFIDLSLAKRQTKEVQSLCKNRNQFKLVNSNYDFLPENSKNLDAAVFYKLPFRIVRPLAFLANLMTLPQRGGWARIHHFWMSVRFFTAPFGVFHMVEQLWLPLLDSNQRSAD